MNLTKFLFWVKLWTNDPLKNQIKKIINIKIHFILTIDPISNIITAVSTKEKLFLKKNKDSFQSLIISEKQKKKNE